MIEILYTIFNIVLSLCAIFVMSALVVSSKESWYKALYTTANKEQKFTDYYHLKRFILLNGFEIIFLVVTFFAIVNLW